MHMPRKHGKRAPTNPGGYIARGLLKDYGFTQQQLADELGVSRRTVNQLVNGQRGVSADMALRLGKLTKTSPELWLNLQRNYNLWHATHDSKSWKRTRVIVLSPRKPALQLAHSLAWRN